MLLVLDIAFKHLGWLTLEQGNIIDCGVLWTEISKRKQVRVADETASKCGDMGVFIQSRVRGYACQGIIGELPSGGAKSAKAMKLMALATACVGCTAALLNLPTEFSTPTEGKMALTGNKQATKFDMIHSFADKLNLKTKWETPPRKKKSRLYIKLCGMWFYEDDAEHIADAYASYLALKSGNLVRMFG